MNNYLEKTFLEIRKLAEFEGVRDYTYTMTAKLDTDNYTNLKNDFYGNSINEPSTGDGSINNPVTSVPIDIELLFKRGDNREIKLTLNDAYIEDMNKPIGSPEELIVLTINGFGTNGNCVYKDGVSAPF